MADSDFSRWVLKNPSGIYSLEYTETPFSSDLGPEDVLVRLYAASLNPRDLVIAEVSD